MSDPMHGERPSRAARRKVAVDYAMTHDLSDGDWQPGGPLGGSIDVMVGRGLRLPVDLDREIRSIAEVRGMPASALMRLWIEAGVARERSTTAVVPLAALHDIIDQLARRAA